MSCPDLTISAQVTPIEFTTAPGVISSFSETAQVANPGAAAVGDPVYFTGTITGGLPDVAVVNLSLGSTVPPVGVLVTAAGGTGVIRYNGPTGDLFSGLTPGARVYADNGGGVTQTPTVVSGYYVAEIGIAMTATEILVAIQRPFRRA